VDDWEHGRMRESEVAHFLSAVASADAYEKVVCGTTTADYVFFFI